MIEDLFFCFLQTYARLPSRLSEFFTLFKLSSVQIGGCRPGAEVQAEVPDRLLFGLSGLFTPIRVIDRLLRCRHQAATDLKPALRQN